MPRIKIFSTATCPYCDRAKSLLARLGIPYEEKRVDSDMAARREMMQVVPGARTVPQIVIDGRPIGGYSELTELHMAGDLDGLAAKG